MPSLHVSPIRPVMYARSQKARFSSTESNQPVKSDTSGDSTKDAAAPQQTAKIGRRSIAEVFKDGLSQGYAWGVQSIKNYKNMLINQGWFPRILAVCFIATGVPLFEIPMMAAIGFIWGMLKKPEPKKPETPDAPPPPPEKAEPPQTA